MTAPTNTIPSTAGMLCPGDLFSVEGGLTIFRVEDVSPNPMDDDEITLTVTTWTGPTASGPQVLPFHFDQAVSRFPEA